MFDIDTYYKDILEKNNFPTDNLSAEQIVLICQPLEAPENFYCDGELPFYLATRRWREKLELLNTPKDIIIKAYELNFK